MKKIILLLGLSLITGLGFSQKSPKEKAKDTILSFWKAYEKDIQLQIYESYRKMIKSKLGKKAAEEFAQLDNKELFFDTSTYKTFNLNVDDTEALQDALFSNAIKHGFYNRKMVEKFKANEISSYFGNVSDLAIQEYYATYNTNDKTISVGKNTSLLGKEKLNRLDWILKTGLTINTNDEFGAIIKNGQLQRNNIVLNLGINKLSDGFVNFEKTETVNYAALMVDHRDNILKGKMFKKVNTYLKEHFDVTVDSIQRLNRKFHNGDGDYETKLNKFAVGKKNKYYSETATQEIKFIKENNLYRSFETSWFSFNVNIPLGNTEVLSANSASSSTIETNEFSAYNANLSWNYLWKKPKGISYFVSPSIAMKNNNNFLANNINSTTFQTIIDQGDSQQSISGQSQVFIGEFEEFVTTTIKIQAASLFIAESLGVRFTFEQNFGEFNATNWSFGVPIIVKEKGKPVLNLELQYRLQNGDNLFGIGTSVLLKSLTK
ncbi:hypothetical protein [Winogradskyella alexanderae]|uniref:DUF3078 domain-containing protein n=1 Tax=Winogradskyella alexanderae TaxID=2877123 RepID=A0ABS7XT56_9FLAO|nr:hypothetical protein [Winogradskyella alexanderae]MCA0132608.1 hypothetical protein [Winogradskyella alexanderae]